MTGGFELCKCVGDVVWRSLSFCAFRMISCFETVPQHISGQPYCNMSTDALEITVKYSINLVLWRLAKSGEDNGEFERTEHIQGKNVMHTKSIAVESTCTESACFCRCF